MGFLCGKCGAKSETSVAHFCKARHQRTLAPDVPDRVPMSDEQAMRVVINACDSLNITRVHELGGKTRTICEEAGLLEIVRAVEKAHGIHGVDVPAEPNNKGAAK